MSMVLVVADADWLSDEVVGTLARRELDVISTSDGRSTVSVCARKAPELIICDSQVGSNGVMAVCRAVRSAEAQGEIPSVRFLALLDRRPDVFLARRADADAWLVKPYEPAALRWTVDVLLSGEEWDEASLEAAMRGEHQPQPLEDIQAEESPAGESSPEDEASSEEETSSEEE